MVKDLLCLLFTKDHSTARTVTQITILYQVMLNQLFSLKKQAKHNN